MREAPTLYDYCMEGALETGNGRDMDISIWYCLLHSIIMPVYKGHGVA
jgi:hypothetical protein